MLSRCFTESEKAEEHDRKKLEAIMAAKDDPTRTAYRDWCWQKNKEPEKQGRSDKAHLWRRPVKGAKKLRTADYCSWLIRRSDLSPMEERLLDELCGSLNLLRLRNYKTRIQMFAGIIQGHMESLVRHNHPDIWEAKYCGSVIAHACSVALNEASARTGVEIPESVNLPSSWRRE